MTSYVIGSSWAYHDYLQAKQFDDSIKLAIDDQTLKQIASDKELARDGARSFAGNLGSHSRTYRSFKCGQR